MCGGGEGGGGAGEVIMNPKLFFFWGGGGESKFKKKTRNVTVCNKWPRRSLIMTLIPGCDLEHSQGTLTLGVGT